MLEKLGRDEIEELIWNPFGEIIRPTRAFSHVQAD